MFGPSATGTTLILGFDSSGGDVLDLSGRGYSVASTAQGNALVQILGSGGTVVGRVELAGVTASQVNGSFFAQ